MQKWKMFHPPGKENQSGKVRRGKEKTVGVAVWTIFIFMIFL